MKIATPVLFALLFFGCIWMQAGRTLNAAETAQRPATSVHECQASLAEANYKYDGALYLYVQSGCEKDRRANIRSALMLFNSAVDLYDTVLKADPKNEIVVKRRTEADMLAYACRKMLELNLIK